MPLWLLGLLVAGGISLIVYLVHASGGSRNAAFSGEAAALSRWAEDFPGPLPKTVVLSADCETAVLDFDGFTGLVTAVGDCFLTRQLHPADIKFARADGALLELCLRDFTFSGGRWRFASAEEAQRAAGWLSAQGGKMHA